MNNVFEFMQNKLTKLSDVNLNLFRHRNACNSSEDYAYLQGTLHGIDISIAELYEAESDYCSGWIPVTERYPDTDDYILMSFSNCSVPQIGRYEEDSEGGAFYLGDSEETCVSLGLFVDAWQPLPPCYKES